MYTIHSTLYITSHTEVFTLTLIKGFVLQPEPLFYLNKISCNTSEENQSNQIKHTSTSGEAYETRTNAKESV